VAETDDPDAPAPGHDERATAATERTGGHEDGAHGREEPVDGRSGRSRGDGTTAPGEVLATPQDEAETAGPADGPRVEPTPITGRVPRRRVPWTRTTDGAPSRRRVLVRRVVALLVLVAIGAGVGLAVSGGEDDAPTRTAAVDATITPATDQSQANRAADREARTLLRGAISAVETCFGATGTYARCRTREELAPFASEAQFGPFLERVVPGAPEATEIAVTVGDRRNVRIVGVSRTRNRFAYVRRLPGTAVQSCRASAFPNPEACSGGRWG
jgi:hypothetical protein